MQGLPAALAFEGFGKFQDNLRSIGKTTAPPAAFNQRLSTILDSDPRLPISAVMERLGSELVKYLDHSGNKLSLSAGLTEVGVLVHSPSYGKQSPAQALCS